MLQYPTGFEIHNDICILMLTAFDVRDHACVPFTILLTRIGVSYLTNEKPLLYTDILLCWLIQIESLVSFFNGIRMFVITVSVSVLFLYCSPVGSKIMETN